MLCGLSRLSGRSALAVATFFPMALLSHHLAHPSLLTEVCTGEVPCYMPVYPSRATTTSLVTLALTTMLASRTLPRLVAKLMPKEGKYDTNSPARDATQFFAGLEFGLGLHITQMSSPAKVASFLSFPNFDVWDPSMALVILFGILPSIVENQTKGFSRAPYFSERFELPKQTIKDTDWNFLLGAAAFGVGWGLSGTCPGPSILRSIAQPAWGLMWMGGFWLGGKLMADTNPDGSYVCG